MKRMALYVRVSTDEQKKHGVSIDEQISTLKAYCADQGGVAAGIYNDAGISARKPYSKRPALLKLLEDCEAGKIDLVIFTRLDRWFRNVGGYYAVQERLDRCHVPWRAVCEDYETETSSGVFKVNIMLSVSQAEADRTSEKIKAVKAYQRSQGKYADGRVPWGYKLQSGQIVLDPEKQPAVEAFFKAYLSTYSISEACKAAKDHGLTVAKYQAHKMLGKTFYTGQFKGCVFPGYITPGQYTDIHDHIQHRQRPAKGRIYLFSGVAYCAECGKRLQAHASRGKTHVYLCSSRFEIPGSCIGSHITEMVLEQYLLDTLDMHLNAYIVHCQAQKDESGKIDYQKQKNALKGRLKRVGDRYEDGDITEAEYREKREKILAEIAMLPEAEEIKIPEALPENWKDIYNQLDAVHKKAFWAKILKGVCVYHHDGGRGHQDGRKYRIEFR